MIDLFIFYSDFEIFSIQFMERPKNGTYYFDLIIYDYLSLIFGVGYHNIISFL